jgi:hypothetical protein
MGRVKHYSKQHSNKHKKQHSKNQKALAADKEMTTDVQVVSIARQKQNFKKKDRHGVKKRI